MLQQVERSPKETRGAANGVQVDAEDADVLQDAVAFECGGVHGGVVLALRQEPVGEEDRDHGVPPGGVIGVDDDEAGGLVGEVVRI